MNTVIVSQSQFLVLDKQVDCTAWVLFDKTWIPFTGPKCVAPVIHCTGTLENIASRLTELRASFPEKDDVGTYVQWSPIDVEGPFRRYESCPDVVTIFLAWIVTNGPSIPIPGFPVGTDRPPRPLRSFGFAVIEHYEKQLKSSETDV